MDDHEETMLSVISPAQKDKKQLPSLNMHNLKKLVLWKYRVQEWLSEMCEAKG